MALFTRKLCSRAAKYPRKLRRGCKIASITVQLLLRGHKGMKASQCRCYMYVSRGSMRLRDVCEALPGLHAFTGCDSTGAFSGWGRKMAYINCFSLERGAQCSCWVDFRSVLSWCHFASNLSCGYTIYTPTVAWHINEQRHQLFCA